METNGFTRVAGRSGLRIWNVAIVGLSSLRNCLNIDCLIRTWECV